MNSQCDDFLSTATTRAIYDVRSDSDHNNWNSSCTSVNNYQQLLSSTSSTVSNIDNDETKENNYQRLVFVLLATLLSLTKKIKQQQLHINTRTNIFIF